MIDAALLVAVQFILTQVNTETLHALAGLTTGIAVLVVVASFPEVNTKTPHRLVAGISLFYRFALAVYCPSKQHNITHTLVGMESATFAVCSSSILPK